MPLSRRRAGETLLGLLAFAAAGALLTRGNVLIAQPATATPTTATQPQPSEPIVADPTMSYTLTAKLDAEQHTIAGSGTIHFRNTTSVPLRELWLHLYLNAFKSEQTLFQRSRFYRGRSGDTAGRPGWVDVHELIAVELGNLDLWPSASRHSPNDPQDQTDIAVPLPQALEPGAALTLQMAWTSQLPELSERTGYAHDFHMVAQWFPKLARLEPSGAWAHFAFHPHAEFYADFADYQVTLDVPAEQVVGASGQRIAEERSADRKQLTYRASSVHDFAWTAWPGFLEHQELIEGVQVRVLYPAAARDLLEREIDSVRFGLPHFNQRYGRYPYSTLTVVHPPATAAAAGGMEYPTLITTGGSHLENQFVRGVELVTIHELGHQWFYGLLASNEAAAPFLDEGLTSYAEAVAQRARFGAASAARLWDLQLSVAALQRAQAASAEHTQAVSASAAQFPSFHSLGALVYARTATILDTLSRAYGEQRMQELLSDYCQKYRFAHPASADFLAHMEAGLGNEAGRALRALLDERGWLDYRVAELHSERDSGSSDGDGAGHEAWLGEVLIERHGTVSLPVEIALIAADGSRTLHRWDGREPWLKLGYRGATQLVGAIIDPEVKLSIDSNLLNNAKSHAGASTARSFERLLYGAQWLLNLVAL